MLTALNGDNNQLEKSHLVAFFLPSAAPPQPPTVALFYLTDNLK
jgi:hypothetical protein